LSSCASIEKEIESDKDREDQFESEEKERGKSVEDLDD